MSDWFDDNPPPPDNWWEGPAPPGHQGPWPPPLQPGQSYGANPGEVTGSAEPTAVMERGAPPGPAPAYQLDPGAVTNSGGHGGSSGGGGGQMGLPTSGFGAYPGPYQSDPNAPVYEELAAYVPPEWTGGDYVNPTQAELEASPGYQSRLNEGLKARTRMAAAGGTILNGGTLKALDRYGQDYATNEYQTLRGNTMEQYKQRYGQFQDKAGMSLQARTVNANEHQNSFQNRTNTYLQGNTRTLTDYMTNLTARRNAELDYWGRLQDVNQTGAGLAGGSR